MANHYEDANYHASSAGPEVPYMLGYAAVPMQSLGNLYDAATALQKGTIFPELNITIEEYTRGIYSGF